MDFQKPYQRQLFLDFLTGFLPDEFMIQEDEVNRHRQFSKLKKIVKLGSVSSIEAGGQPLKIYEVEHVSESDPRVTLTREFFDVMRQELTTRALIIFHSKKSTNYRFSLMTVDFTLDGKKVHKDFSNPRRYSFYLGPEAKVRTPYNLLFKKGKVKNQDDLISRFSVEVVTKEFFDNYRKLFEGLYDYLKKDKAFSVFANNNNISIENFTKKLLGQIVFLYFLQRKGWLGAKKNQKINEGDKNFLRSLFDKCVSERKNFFNSSLEYLFYASLNKRPEKAANFYREYFDCQIPFLNGGLFEPINNYNWKSEFLDIPNKIFSNSDKTGILDVFDLYNFTIDESLPNDQEVSIDPEMLGKVFENLLEENLRKGKGTYYTPREIVHYMCQENLINYLTTEIKTPEKKIRTLVARDMVLTKEDVINAQKSKGNKDKAADKILVFWEEEAKELDKILANIKVVDPACGSGAFLVGMLQEIIKARQILQMFTDKPESEYKLKKETIQNCIYGVDIDPGAVEIAKLRLWLSLTVDSDLEDIEPLPNLDYKIMQGNSLIEELILGNTSIKLFDSELLDKKIDQKRDEIIQNIDKKVKAIQREYLRLHNIGKLDRGRKRSLDNELAELKKERKELIKKPRIQEKDLFTTKDIGSTLNFLHTKYFNEGDIEKKKELKNEIDKIEADLIEQSIQRELAKFKNKKYEFVTQKGIQKDTKTFAKDLSRQVQISNILKEYKQSGIRPFFLWHLNFADVFEDKGGFDIVIANPPYIDSESMVKKGQRNIREVIQKTYVFAKGNWDIYIAFFELAFRKINNLGVLTFITPDKWMSKPFGEELRRNTIKNIFKIVRAGRDVFESSKVDSIISFFSRKQNQKLKILEFKDKRFIFKREIDKRLIREPFALDWLFSDYLDFLIRIDLIPTRAEDLGNCENACATSDAYKLEPLIKNLSNDFDRKSQLKIINTGTIGKYYSKWGKQEMTYLGHKYLKPIIKKEKFFSLFRNSYAKKSIQPKIILKGLNLLDACLDIDGDTIPGKSTLIVTSNDINKLKLLLAIINSKLVYFYLKEKFIASSYNQGISFTKEMINNLPVPKIVEKDQKSINKIVDKILNLTKSSDYLQDKAKQAKVQEYEKQIDEMVYKLYGLTEEERRIVEQK